MTTNKTYIIAEAGVNHNGDINLAKKLIEAAADAGADAVKFQTFKADLLVSPQAIKAEYQQKTTDASESQYEMLKKLELDKNAHEILIDHCRKFNIQFLSTPFDNESAELLSAVFDLPFIKIPSGEITNAPLLLKIAQTGKPVILSTGMSTLGEIEDALGVLAFGYLKECTPSLHAFRKVLFSDEGQVLLKKKVSLLHCTTEYPAPVAEVNLKAMDTLVNAFGLPVGFSDHTNGIAIALAAVARGASILEKHFTLNKSLPGPDHKASLEPTEFKEMVSSIRQIEKAIGTGHKLPSPSEIKNIAIARKSLVASCRIEIGERLSSEKITAKRPCNGISPMHFMDISEHKAHKSFEKDELITWKNLI